MGTPDRTTDASGAGTPDASVTGPGTPDRAAAGLESTADGTADLALLQALASAVAALLTQSGDQLTTEDGRVLTA